MQSRIREDTHLNKTSIKNTTKKRIKLLAPARGNPNALCFIYSGIKWFLRAISHVLGNAHDAAKAPLPIIPQTHENRDTLGTTPGQCPPAHNGRGVTAAGNGTPKPLRSPRQDTDPLVPRQHAPPHPTSPRCRLPPLPHSSSTGTFQALWAPRALTREHRAMFS